MQMTQKPPPVPPQNRSDKGPGSDPKRNDGKQKTSDPTDNLREQGRYGNIKQNTTNQGYQQDR
jgi:hypothetical protein